MATFTSNSPLETEKIGREIAAQLRPVCVDALQGELGSGKTHFTKGLVAGLGSAAPVTSPTFTIIHEYPGGRWPIYHFDFFRLENEESVLQLGVDEYFYGEGISVVEWADRFPRLVPPDAKWVTFRLQSENEREISTK